MYRTRVEDVYDNIVIVAAPIEQGTLVPIRLDTELNIEYKDTSAKSQGRYRAPAIVETRQRGQVATISLRLVGEWQKIQDRQFVRVDVFIEATYALVLDDEVQGIRTCIVRNLSGGGLWMDAEEALRRRLYLDMPSAGARAIRLTAKSYVSGKLKQASATAFRSSIFRN